MITPFSNNVEWIYSLNILSEIISVCCCLALCRLLVLDNNTVIFNHRVNNDAKHFTRAHNSGRACRCCRLQAHQKEWLASQAELLAQGSVLRAELNASQLERTRLEGELSALKETHQSLDLSNARLTSQYQVWADTQKCIHTHTPTHSRYWCPLCKIGLSASHLRHYPLEIKENASKASLGN